MGADLKEFVPKVSEQIDELASFETSILGPDFDARAPLVAVLREGDLFKPNWKPFSRSKRNWPTGNHS